MFMVNTEDIAQHTMRTVDEMHMSPADVLTAEQDVFRNFQSEKEKEYFSIGESMRK